MLSGHKTIFYLATIIVFVASLVWLPNSHPAPAFAQAGDEFASDGLLIRFRPGASIDQKGKARNLVNASLAHDYDLVPGLQHWHVQAGRSEHAVAALSQLPFVQYAEVDQIVQAVETAPNDPRFPELWGMQNIRAPLAWDTTTGDSNLVVAIIDTGIDYNHPDLAANIWTNPGETAGNGIDDDKNGYIDDIHGYDFAYKDSDPSDVYGHGTHTAGTVGAVGNNGAGVSGVNWNIKLAAVKFLNDSGSGTISDAILAIQYCTQMGFKISNNSWGGGGYNQAMYDAINQARLAGHLFVAAAGNNSNNNDSYAFYPATYDLDNIISVAAIDNLDNRASFSNYGARTVDLGAPGVNVLSTTPNNTYSFYNGTSMATPHVAGAAASLFALHPDWTSIQVRNQIFNTVRPVTSMRSTTVTGGVLDLGAAISTTPPNLPPASPANLVAQAISGQQINLRWVDNSWNEDGFMIERCSGAGCTNFSLLATLASNTTGYSDLGLAAGTSYSYQVLAYNANGNSGYSNVASAVTVIPLRLHVGVLSGSSQWGLQKRWTATVMVTVHDFGHHPIAGATVTGNWNKNTPVSCVTGNDGVCTLSKDAIQSKTASVTFGVTNISLNGYQYDPGWNDTPASIIINRP